MKYLFITKAIHLFLKIRFYFGVYFILIILIRGLEIDGKNIHKKRIAYSKSKCIKEWRNRSILVFEKTGLLEDLTAVAQNYGRRFPTLILIPRFYVNILAEYFLPANQRNDFLTRLEYDEKAHDRYKSLCNYIFPRLAKKFDAKILISANYTYGNERDIHEVAVANFLKVVILYKECLMSNADSENLVELLANSRPFVGSKILVYNRVEEERQLKSLAVKKVQIHTTGSPRFDRLIAKAESKVHVRDARIVFFVHDYIPEGDIWYVGGVRNAFREYSNQEIVKGLLIFLESARKFPQIHFTIKTKVTLSTIQYVGNFLASHKLPENIQVIFGNGLAETALSNCVGALGFNTTALIDSVASGAQIATLSTSTTNIESSAQFREAIRDYLIDYEELATEITGSYSLELWINDILSKKDLDGFLKKELTAKGRKLLETTVGNPDGNSSSHVLRELFIVDQNN